MARTVVVPRGSWLSGAASTAMIVAGVGLAVDGLLLAAAGVLLALLDWDRFKAANPWAFPDPKQDPEAAAAALGGEVARVSLAGTAAIVGSCLVAVAAVQMGDDRLLAVPPAVLAAVMNAAFTRRLIAALERG